MTVRSEHAHRLHCEKRLRSWFPPDIRALASSEVHIRSPLVRGLPPSFSQRSTRADNLGAWKRADQLLHSSSCVCNRYWRSHGGVHRCLCWRRLHCRSSCFVSSLPTWPSDTQSYSALARWVLRFGLLFLRATKIMEKLLWLSLGAVSPAYVPRST